MSGISLGTGLMSGLPTADIIDQLMAVERRPLMLIQQRNDRLSAQQDALREVNAKLLAVKLSANGFTTNRNFRSF
ncbi:flagellar cap protein FliD N-terminal domain-containing protein, partial [Phycisphaerales bacterium AB-hyl4]